MFSELKSLRSHLVDLQWPSEAAHFSSTLPNGTLSVHYKSKGLVFQFKLDVWIEMTVFETVLFTMLNFSELKGITDFKELHSYLVENKS